MLGDAGGSLGDWAAAVNSHARKDANNKMRNFFFFFFLLVTFPRAGKSQEAWERLGKRPNCSQAGWVAGWPER